MSIQRAANFFQGLNPYTGEVLTERSYGASYAGTDESAGYYSSTPQDTVASGSATATGNPNEVLDPLYNAQQYLSKAKSGLEKVRQFWDKVDGEIGTATSQTHRAQNDLYPAESDDEDTDHSRTGRWANRSLDQIEQSLQRLQWESSAPTYALYEVKQHVASAQSYLSSINPQRLPNAWKHQQAVQYVNDFQTRIYRIEQAQNQLESKLSAVQTPMSEARYDLNQVENDRDGMSVAGPAREARQHLTTLASQLQQVEQHLRYSTSDLSGAESALSTAEQSVAQAHSEYQYSWHTSDRRQ